MHKDELEKILPKENIKYNEPMYKHTSFKTGGLADYYIIAKTTEQVQKVIDFSKQNNILLYVVGNCSNLLVLDEGFRGIILKIEIENIDINEQKEHVTITIGAGVKIMALAQILLQNEITGFEEFSGIPRHYRWSKCNECRCIWKRNKRHFNRNKMLE